VIFGLTPFEISTARFEFEIKSEEVEYLQNGTKFVPTDSQPNIRPDILVNTVDERELIIVRKAEELDASNTYRVLTAAPRIAMKYDMEKNHCPKFEVIFYMEVSLQSYCSKRVVKRTVFPLMRRIDGKTASPLRDNVESSVCVRPSSEQSGMPKCR
jgi:hypothetical protein